jgi:hypothetical protein
VLFFHWTFPLDVATLIATNRFADRFLTSAESRFQTIKKELRAAKAKAQGGVAVVAKAKQLPR